MTSYGRRLGWLVAVAALVLAGCGGGSPRAAGAPATTSPASLFAFTATTVDGKPFDGMSMAGKPTVLWFWAPWCPICLLRQTDGPARSAPADSPAGRCP